MADGAVLRVQTRLENQEFKASVRELENEIKQLKRGVESSKIKVKIDANEKELDKALGRLSELEEKGKGFGYYYLHPEAKEELDQQVSLVNELQGENALLRAEYERAQAIEQEQIVSKEKELALMQQQKIEQDLLNAKEKDRQATEAKILGMSLKMMGAMFGVQALYSGIRKIMNDVLSTNTELKNTLDMMWASLASIAEPAVQGLISGFATILSYAIQILSVITGINILAKAQAKMAKKAGGGKSNSLASFDKSEVLKRGGGAGGGTQSLVKAVKLSENLNKLIQGLKDIIDPIVHIVTSFWENTLKPMLVWLWDFISPIFGILGTGLSFIGKILSEIVVPILDKLFELIGDNPAIAWLLIAIPLIVTHLGTFVSVLSTIWTIGTSVFGFLISAIGTISQIVLGLVGVLFILNTVFALLGIDVMNVINDMMDMFRGLIDFVVGVFTGDWEKAWNGIKTFFFAIWNAIIDTIQNGVNAMIHGINRLAFDIPDWIPVVGGKHVGFKLDDVDLSKYKLAIPALAQGAVIQPNAPFLAMLGDQMSGRNIEAPESLLRQVVAEESNRQVVVNITANGDLGELIRMLHFELAQEDNRQGTILISGGKA